MSRHLLGVMCKAFAKHITVASFSNWLILDVNISSVWHWLSSIRPYTGLKLCLVLLLTCWTRSPVTWELYRVSFSFFPPPDVIVRKRTGFLGEKMQMSQRTALGAVFPFDDPSLKPRSVPFAMTMECSRPGSSLSLVTSSGCFCERWSRALLGKIWNSEKWANHIIIRVIRHISLKSDRNSDFVFDSMLRCLSSDLQDKCTVQIIF